MSQPHGLVIRESKFHKSRLVSLHPLHHRRRSTRISQFGERRRPRTIISSCSTMAACLIRTPVSRVFRKLAIKTGIRTGTRRPRVHDLRHRFATRSLEALDAAQDPTRHMLALATYLGHVDPVSTYWYLEDLSGAVCATSPRPPRRTFTTGGGHD